MRTIGNHHNVSLPWEVLTHCQFPVVPFRECEPLLLKPIFWSLAPESPDYAPPSNWLPRDAFWFSSSEKLPIQALSWRRVASPQLSVTKMRSACTCRTR